MKYYRLTKERREINNPIRIHPLLFCNGLTSRLNAYKLARALNEVILLHRPIEILLNDMEAREGFGTTKFNSIFYNRFCKELRKRGWQDHEVEHKLVFLAHFNNQEYLVATVRKQMPSYFEDLYDKKVFRRTSSRQRRYKL